VAFAARIIRNNEERKNGGPPGVLLRRHTGVASTSTQTLKNGWA
jgi:hypothetical protein